MAHFAELNESNEVIRVIVVSNEDTADADGNEVEAIGIQFCTDLLGGRWIQTSYNANFRAHFAGGGMTYDEDLDEFVPAPLPFLTQQILHSPHGYGLRKAFGVHIGGHRLHTPVPLVKTVLL